MSSIDFADSLAGYLRAYPGVNALAGVRVYPAELPAEQADDQPRYAVVVVPMGGSGPASDERWLMPKIDVTCYGATPKQARTLWLAVGAALQELRRAVWAGCLLHSAIPLAGPIQMRHPETHWPMVWGSWQVTVGVDEA
jgi:hypothetical protein